MLHNGTHISIDAEAFVARTLYLDPESFREWPESVRKLTMELASELFLLRYNPYIEPGRVKESVNKRFSEIKNGLAESYAKGIGEGIRSFWDEQEADLKFRDAIISRLREFLPPDSIDTRPGALVERATDATDLRMELPFMVLLPQNTGEISAIARLSNEMGFCVIPRGGGTGLTGGAIPGGRRCVILSLERLTAIKEVNARENYICVEAGVITNDAFKAAAARNLLFTVDPASKAASSIGGNISENSGGPMAFEYGSAIDCILSYRMVMPDGGIVDIIRKDHPRHKIMPEETAIFEVRAVSGNVSGDIPGNAPGNVPGNVPGDAPADVPGDASANVPGNVPGDVPGNVPGDSLIKEIRLSGMDVRAKGLGKDVTNKFLGGLPGVQKEGVDGVITEACFVLYPKPAHMRVMVLEFYGRSMRGAMEVIKRIVSLRDEERRSGDRVKITALEEFNIKYVQAIEYKKKSTLYDGEPISVLILQLDSDDQSALEDMSRRIVDICAPLNEVDAFVAKDDKEAELFWEDRHRLSAISKRTSGFKINEDIVIPMEVIPEFSVFLERLNIECLAREFRDALHEIGGLAGFPDEDKEFNQMFTSISRLIKGESINCYEIDKREANLAKRLAKQGKRVPKREQMLDAYVTRLQDNALPALEKNEQELEVHCSLFLSSLVEKYPYLKEEIEEIEQRMRDRRIIVASHMHAGDGNCHVNIPVNSNDPRMLKNAETTAGVVMSVTQGLHGAVTGEHGIGITKIAFLSDQGLENIRQYKQQVDPHNIFNPGKLTQRELPVRPFTFSFNKLIQDIRQSGLRDQDKDTLAQLLQDIQICNRCGKCKHVCAMHYPGRAFFYYPRNKNISLGALVEAIFYSKGYQNTPDPRLLSELRRLMEHCTGCGKCMAVCPVKINSADVALKLRSFAAERKAGGHPLKTMMLDYLVKDPAKRIPQAAKAAALGQKVQSAVLPHVIPVYKHLPENLRSRIKNPLLTGPSPHLDLRGLGDALRLARGNILLPASALPGSASPGPAFPSPGRPNSLGHELPEAVFYFPGCGASIFYRNIGLASIQMLLRAGYAVVLPEEHLCCGYPLLAAGSGKSYSLNQERNIQSIRKTLSKADKLGLNLTHVLTACGTCRDSIGRHDLPLALPKGMPPLEYMDVVQFLMSRPGEWTAALENTGRNAPGILYQAACHAEWVGVNKVKAVGIYAKALEKLSNAKVQVSPGCCGESGMGAMSSPEIYNYLRERKSEQIYDELEPYPDDAPVVVGCPSCKVGISRILLGQKLEGRKLRPVLHTLEYLADLHCGPQWREKLLHSLREAGAVNGLRHVNPDDRSVLTPAELEEVEDI